jgi:hypothetical protein
MGSSTKSGKNCVVVGKIHVLFNPKRGDVKLGQLLDWNLGSLFIKVGYGKEMETEDIYAKTWWPFSEANHRIERIQFQSTRVILFGAFGWVTR